jgi:predicted NAD-dependent protein-ADP-ribosyltransferase YbiA (DUF1768 family)/uncharacterized protein YukE
MVLSKLNKKINYPEIKTVYKSDINKEKDLYKLIINDIPILIAIGGIQYNFIQEYNIVIYAIYLIQKNKKSIQIGLYELIFDDIEKNVNDKQELNIENLEPLLYSFVNNSFLMENKMNEASIKEIVDFVEKDELNDLQQSMIDNKKTKINIPEYRKDIFTINPETLILPELNEEKEKDAKDNIEKYHEQNADIWVQKFMKNKNYYIQDNEGKGDCFFATIRDAFKSIGQETTIIKLRNKLSKEITEDTFMNYKNQYDLFNNSIKNDIQHLTQIKNEIKELKEKIEKNLNNNENKEIITRIKQLKVQYDKIKTEMEISKENLSDFKFFKNIKNVNDFKNVIKTCDFWADIWAIETIERLLNIKIIIFSSQSYQQNDLLNIIKCGMSNTSKTIYEPEYYIILDHTGNHYKLIGYKNKQIFKFKELPFHIKEMVVNKCMEGEGGLFNLIPEFNRFKMFLHKDHTNEIANIDKEITESELRNLFDEEIVFLIYSKANDKNSPGKSSGEKIPKEKIRDYAQLKNHKDWRRKLDDNWICEFVLDNHKWASVIHYVEGSKYKKENPNFYNQFSLDSQSKISKDPELAKKIGETKTGIIKGEMLKPKNINKDLDFELRKNKEHLQALEAKFKQNDELKEILLETKRAKLMNYIPKKESEVANNLMIVREKLLNQ